MLTGNTNQNQLISTIQEKLILKRVKELLTKRKDKRENWMTDELLNQINRKNDMYVDWIYKSKSVDIYNTRKANFETCERIVNKNIQEAKRVYYFNSFKNCKTNI